jgi:hypothetical protein
MVTIGILSNKSYLIQLRVEDTVSDELSLFADVAGERHFYACYNSLLIE